MNTCKNCGIKIEKHRKYCSLSCRNIYVNKNLRDYTKNGNGLRNKTTVFYNENPKICKECGNPIPYNKRNNIFCSKKCRGNSLIKWNENRTGIKKNFTKEGMESILNATRKRYNTYEYDANPNHCKQCNSILPYNKRKNIFCNVNCRRTYDKRNMSDYQKYYRKCQFNFTLNDFPDEFEFTLIEEYGWYKAKNHGNNLNGVSRDHMISIKYGYENKINPELIRHPANCKLMLHNDNVRKYKTSSITLVELIEKIKIWDFKYNINVELT